MLTFKEYLKKHNFNEILMHSNDYPWSWDRGYKIREEFKKRYKRYKRYMANLVIGEK